MKINKKPFDNSNYELIKALWQTGKVKTYRYTIQFLGREYGERILSCGCNYKVAGYFKFIDSPSKILTIDTFSPKKRDVKKNWDVRGPIKIIKKVEIV